jgi:hypothetical protein
MICDLSEESESYCLWGNTLVTKVVQVLFCSETNLSLVPASATRSGPLKLNL